MMSHVAYIQAALHPHSSYIAIAYENGSVSIHDLQSGHAIASATGASDKCCSITFLGSDSLISSSKNGSTVAWQIPGKLLASCQAWEKVFCYRSSSSSLIYVVAI